MKKITIVINVIDKNNKIFIKDLWWEFFSAADDEDVVTKNILYVTIVYEYYKKCEQMIEPLLCGIVLGLVPITLLGLFVSAWNQYRRGSGLLDLD